MSKEGAFKIGQAIQSIALMVDDNTLNKIRDKLDVIESVVLEELEGDRE